MAAETVLGAAEFAAALGVEPSTLSSQTRTRIERASLKFAPIDSAEQAALEVETAEQIRAGFTVVGEHRAGIWRDAWQEQLERFEQAGFDVESLNPKFMADTAILRWQGRYVRGVSNRFELALFEILRDWVFRTHLADVSHLYEFGSGSGFNVAAYAKLFPNIPITALDWAPAAVQIAELLRERLRMDVRGRRFDFFSPDPALTLAKGSGVLTMCALEQTGDRFGTVIDFLIAQRPRRVVHVEPIVELYDASLRHDQLAIEYHTQRKYLAGLLPALEKHAKAGRIRIPYVRRLRFGSRFHECFTVVVWEPV